MKSTKLLTALLITITLLTLSLCAQAAIRYTLTDLGTLGGNSSNARAINDHGQVVGSSQTAEGPSHAFLYDGTMHDLGVLSGTLSGAMSINNKGQVAGYWADDAYANRHPFMYDGTMHNLQFGESNSVAIGINDSGVITGTYGMEVFIYDGEAYVLPDIRTLFGKAYGGINNSGQITGCTQDYGYRISAYLYDGQMHDLGSLCEGVSYGYAINDSGQTTGYSSSEDGHYHAFLYDGTMHDLGLIPGVDSSVGCGINNIGQVVGYASTPNVTERAIIYDGTAMYDLNDLINPTSGWTLREARDINNNGQIVGYGYNALGQGRAFLLTPVPEPSSALCIVAGVLWVGGVIRPKNR